MSSAILSCLHFVCFPNITTCTVIYFHVERLYKAVWTSSQISRGRDRVLMKEFEGWIRPRTIACDFSVLSQTESAWCGWLIKMGHIISSGFCWPTDILLQSFQIYAAQYIHILTIFQMGSVLIMGNNLKDLCLSHQELLFSCLHQKCGAVQVPMFGAL